MTMRDTYFGTITYRAKEDPTICIVTADMSAPGLDEFRTLYPHRYINVGIAEQAAIQVACGLALEDMKPIVFAIQPFASLRCYEQIKVLASLMNIPITIVGVGAGFGYADSGPTHHALEDLAIMRILPHMTVWNPSTPYQAARMAGEAGKYLQYVRLDREDLPGMPGEFTDDTLKAGYIAHKGHDKRYIVTTSNMVHRALEVAAEVDIGVIEIFRIPADLTGKLHGMDVIVLEENNIRGGLYSYIAEEGAGRICGRGLDLSTGYDYVYGGRANIQTHYGLNKESLVKWLKSVL